MSPANPDRLYQQNHCGIFRLDRPATRWIDIGGGMPKAVGSIGFPVCLHPRDADTLWVFPMDGSSVWPRTSPGGSPPVFRSTNGGRTWQRQAKGFPGGARLVDREAPGDVDRSLRWRRPLLRHHQRRSVGESGRGCELATDRATSPGDLRGRGRVNAVHVPHPRIAALVYGGAERVDLALVRPALLGDGLAELDARFPGLRFRVVDEQGKIRPHIKMFVNAVQARDLATPLPPGAELMIVGALSEGDRRAARPGLHFAQSGHASSVLQRSVRIAAACADTAIIASVCV
jgi:hypothetical protein